MPLTSSITPYDPSWPQRYAMAIIELTPIFGELVIATHHVGSTAVPGLPAKPEIDILAVAAISCTPTSWTERLGELGYRRGSDLSPGHRFFKRDVGGVRTHKLHVCSIGHDSVDGMLRFRDHLRHHAEDRASYARLKLQLERENVGGISEYLAHKRPFIEQILARFSGP